MDRNGISAPLFERDSGLILKKKSSSSFFGSVRNTLHRAALGAKSATDHARGEDVRTEDDIILEAQPPRASSDTQASCASSSSSQKHRRAFPPHSAVASLRGHLTSRKHTKRPTILGNIVPTTTDGRSGFDNPNGAHSPTTEERGRTRTRRFSNFMGSVRGLGGQRGSIRLVSTSADDWNHRDPLYRHPEPPAEPIDIPRPPPLPLRLDLPPMSKLMPSPFQSSDDEQPVDSSFEPHGTTAPFSPFRFPVSPETQYSTPSQCLPEHTAHELGLLRLPDQPTPMPSTNLAMEINPFETLDGVREPKVGIRKIRSLNDMLDGEHISDSSGESTRPLAPSSIIRKPRMADSVAGKPPPRTESPESIWCSHVPIASHRDKSTGRYLNRDPLLGDALPIRSGPPSPDRMTVLPLRFKARAPTSDSDWETTSLTSDKGQATEYRTEQRRSESSNVITELREVFRGGKSWAELTSTAIAGACASSRHSGVIGEDGVYFGSTDISSGSEVSSAPGVEVREYCTVGEMNQQPASISTNNLRSTSESIADEVLLAPGVTVREKRAVGREAQQPALLLANPFESGREDRRRAQPTNKSTATTSVQSEYSIPVSPMMVQELFYDSDADAPRMKTEREIHAGSEQTGWGETGSEHSSHHDVWPEWSHSRRNHIHEVDANRKTFVSDPIGDPTQRHCADDEPDHRRPNPVRNSSGGDSHGARSDPQGGDRSNTLNSASFSDSNGAATPSTQLSPLAKQFYGHVRQSPSRGNLLAASTMCHLPQWSDPVWNLALNPNLQTDVPSRPPSQFNRALAQQPSLDSDGDNQPPILPLHLRHLTRTEHTYSATQIRGATPLPSSLTNEFPEHDNPALTCNAPILQPPYPRDSSAPPDPHDSALATPDLAPIERQGELSRAPTPLPVPEGILLIRRDELRASDLKSVSAEAPALQTDYGHGDRSTYLEHVLALPRASRRMEAESSEFQMSAGFREERTGAARGVNAGLGTKKHGRRLSGSDDWSVLAGMRQGLRKKVPRKVKSADARTSLLTAAVAQAGMEDDHAAAGERSKGRAPAWESGSGRISPLSARPGGSNRYAALAESSTGSDIRPRSSTKQVVRGAGGQENVVERNLEE